ncbi:MAG: hypothetical protein U0636_10045 [Phycisphaerales bacterium]
MLHRFNPPPTESANGSAFRKVTVGSLGTDGAFNLSLTGSTHQQRPAIFAWQEVHADVKVVSTVISGGLYLLAYRITPNADGTWHYEYALQNVNSDLAAGVLKIPTSPNVAVINTGFHGVAPHSGELVDSSDWDFGRIPSRLTWRCPLGSDESLAPHLLRWGTLYNFWFDADVAPRPGMVSVQSMSESNPIVQFVAQVPSSGPMVGDLNDDLVVDGTDLGLLLGAWVTGDSVGDLNNDGAVDGSDLGVLLGSWGAQYW